MTTTAIQDKLNRAMPANASARLGDVVYDLINAYNNLAKQYNALLAHIDAGNVTGLGTANAATYGETTTVLLPEQRSYAFAE